MIRKRRFKLGDVYAIKLPDNRYGFGRVFKEGTIAIYMHISGEIDDLPKEERYLFTVGVYRDVLTSSEWELVDYRPFKNDDEAWPPKMCIVDPISGEYSIYYRGEITPSSEAECVGLEEVAAWDAHHVVDRIMGIDIWHKRRTKI